MGDGDGWVRCDRGHRHWGRYGAAGLLLWHRSDGLPQVLLAHRARWSHHGGTWGLLGGARDSHETQEAAALREAAEEGGLDPADFRLTGTLRDDHGGWSYTSLVAVADRPPRSFRLGGEVAGLGWLTREEVAGLALHPGFADTWPVLSDALRRLVVVVDAANVMGSRPDGWWRDRAGAVRRLFADIEAAAARPMPATAMPDGVELPGLTAWWPEFVLVVEGKGRDAELDPSDRVSVIRAPGSGDDRIVEAVQEQHPDDLVLVVTADRELRSRCAALGAQPVGPSWLLGHRPDLR